MGIKKATGWGGSSGIFSFIYGHLSPIKGLLKQCTSKGLKTPPKLK
jgi:hypothetical protein